MFSGCQMRMLTAFCLLAFTLSAQAQLYRWTDAGGNVHYTDTQPPAGAKNVEKKAEARPSPAQSAAAQQSYALQQAVKNYPVTVYTAADCGKPCKEATDYLKKRGVPFKEDVVATREQIEALTKLAGAPRVPVMVVGSSIQKDFEERAWSEALDTAGYPKSTTP